jgi:hypothetical protein
VGGIPDKGKGVKEGGLFCRKEEYMRGGLKVLGYVAGAMVLVVAALHILQRPTTEAPEPTPAASSPERSEAPVRRGMRPLPLPPTEVPNRFSPPTPTTPPARSTTHYASTAWEQQIDRVLTSQLAVEEQAQQLQSVFYSLPMEGQVEAAGHLANLTADEDYTLGDIICDERAPLEALQLLMTDLSRRPDAIRLPMLIRIAEVTNHPFRAEALEDLTFLLQEDHGSNWAAWEAAVQKKLSADANESAK